MSTTELLTSAQACDLLGGIDRSTLSRWVALGWIEPATKLPGLRGPYLFAPAEIARVKAKREQATS